VVQPRLISSHRKENIFGLNLDFRHFFCDFGAPSIMDKMIMVTFHGSSALFSMFAFPGDYAPQIFLWLSACSHPYFWSFQCFQRIIDPGLGPLLPDIPLL